MKLLFVCSIVFAQQALAVLNISLDPAVEPPALLSQTGVLGDELVEYKIIQALWVDFAVKKRKFYLPRGERVVFSAIEDYKFPVGSIFVKHFAMEISKNIFQNLETRILVRKTGETPEKWVGYTYKWDGEDAKLVDERSNPELALTIDASAEGGARTQNYKIPNRRQCIQCHNESVGYVRSFNTRQLNREFQLDNLNQQKIFDRELAPANSYEKFAAIDDIEADLEKRVRTYLDVNCSHCHNPGPAAMCNFTNMDFRFSHFDVAALVSTEHLVKGNKELSVIFQRMSSVQTGNRMPYIGTALQDEAALKIVGVWIESLHD